MRIDAEGMTAASFMPLQHCAMMVFVVNSLRELGTR
jgi:hypothetical protein